jgi:acetate kinase
MENVILSLNAGSSSLKFAVYKMEGGGEERIFSGAVEEIAAAQGRLWLRGAGNRTLLDRQARFSNHGEALENAFTALAGQGARTVIAAGHRVVHGGPFFSGPQKIDGRMCDRLRELIPFAPLHLPSQIAMIEELFRRRPSLPQVACFDTAFHRGMPEVARRFALPRKLWDQGVLRYGFHGLSYEFVVREVGEDLGRRAVIAHLGNGASMVALLDGAAVDTSMGLTPTGGFMMGTRTGDLDPGVILYLLRQGWTVEQLEVLLDRESGLLGVSGLTSDMRALLEQTTPDSGAAQAVEMFCYQVRKFIGAYAAALGGLDMLVFTAGIGERSAEIRARICQGLEFLGVELDAAANEHHAVVISRGGSRCTVRVVKTDEDLMIARHTMRLVFAARETDGMK